MSVFLLAIISLLIATSTAKITAYFSNTRNTLLGGQFDPARGGQFAPAGGGQFLPAKGGQFIRFLHHTDCLDEKNVTVQEKQIILDFMWYHWDKLKERSIRSILKMTETMRENPETYKVIWEIDSLKRN